jgi:hypothetical protein
MARLLAKQLSASGFVTQQRALFKQLLIFHPINDDSEYKFYDLATTPVGGEPYYTFQVHGKKSETLGIPEPGVLFDDGIYVTVIAGTTVTVFYEEV